MNNKYPPFAFAGAFILQWWLWSRASNIVKDSHHSDIWYLQNVGLVGLALLLLAPVLRHGVTWQRVVAGIVCVVPLACIAGWFYYSLKELTER